MGSLLAEFLRDWPVAGRPVSAAWALFLVSSLGGGFAWAGAEPSIPGSRYTAGRAAAMGGAFLPLADDAATGLFYNPAGIGSIRNPRVELMNLQIHANSGYISNFDFLKSYKVTGLESYASELTDAFQGGSFALMPSFQIRGLAFGALIENRVAAKKVGSDITYRSLYQVIPALGGGVRLFSGILRLGYSLQYVSKASGEITVPDSTVPLGYNQQLTQGSALSHTVGVSVTLPFAYLPSINVVGRNVLGTTYSRSSIFPLARNDTGAPGTEEATYDASFSVQPKLGRGAYNNVVFQLSDVTNRTGFSILQRSAIGFEFTVRNAFFLRAGYGHLYPSAGVGFKSKEADFSLTWLSEEVGTPDATVQDTRYMFQYKIKTF